MNKSVPGFLFSLFFSNMNAAVAINNAAKAVTKPSSQTFILRAIAGIVFVVLALVALKYMYNYLYGETTGSSFKLVNGPRAVVSDGDNKLSFNAKEFAQITEGGEYTVSFWLYVNQWSQGIKPIVRIGGGNFDTLVVYLDKSKNILHVRTSSQKDANDTVHKIKGVDLYDPSSADVTTQKCDITNFELQRWVCVTITLNNNTTDVYLDGKLARSCVNDEGNYFKVDGSPSLEILGNNDKKPKFGGYISNVVTYNYSLNPDEVYRNYMAGPDPSYTALTYLLSLFNPSAYGEGVTKVKV